MAKESLVELVKWGAGKCISTNPQNEYETRNKFAKEIAFRINLETTRKIEISTCLTHLRTLLQEGILTETRKGTMLNYSIQKVVAKNSLAAQPLLATLPLITYTPYNNVESLGITLSQNIASSICELLNERCNEKNIFFQAIGSKAIMCYYFKSDHSADINITLNEYLQKIFGGLRFFKDSDSQENSLELSYDDIYAKESFVYDTTEKSWIAQPSRPIDGKDK